MRSQDDLQQAAYASFVAHDYKGLVSAATGSGKSKLGIMAAEEVFIQDGTKTDIVIVAPYTKLLTDNWPAEFNKHNAGHLLVFVTFVTYASFHKLPKKKRSLIIMDEVHHLTALNIGFFKNNKQERILMLTATPPEEQEKRDLIGSLGPMVYTYGLDSAVSDGLVANYRIHIVDCFLDNKEKYIPGGKKTAPFMTTEASGYLFLDKQIKKAQCLQNTAWMQALIQKRMHMVYNLRSKTEIAKKLLAKLGADERVIIFCGSIAQADELGGTAVYHSKSGSQALDDFKSGSIPRLFVVKALDEGHNIDNVDTEVIVQASSVERQQVQRIGRAIRFREGHTARIFILSTEGTVDKKWVLNSLMNFDVTKISHYSSNNL
jgi:superfamily II DNA or RNA helicase